MRQEFAAQPRAHHTDDGQKTQTDREHRPPARQRPAQHRQIDGSQKADEDRFGLVDMLGQQERRQRRRNREGRDQCTCESIAVSPRHRTEDLAFDALHGEQRNEGGDRDQRRKEDRFIDLQDADEDQAQPVGPGVADPGPILSRIRAPCFASQMGEGPLPVRGRRLEITKYVFDEDHRRIDDDAEIDGADGQEIGVLPHQNEDDHTEEQRERDVHADDDGAAQITKENPLDQEHEQAAEHQVVQHRMGRDRNQRSPIIIRNELHPRRQCSIGIHFLDSRLDAGQHIVGMQRAVHHHDRQRHIVVMILARDAKSRHEPDRDLGNVLDGDRSAVDLGQHNLLDIPDPIALGQIVGSATVDQPDAADVDRLLADRDLAPADVDIGIAERGDDLRNRDAVGVELVQIDLNLILLGGAAPGVHLHHARHRKQAAQDDPILHRPQVGQSEMRRPHHLVTKDLTCQARLLDLRNLVLRQRHVLLKTESGLGIGRIIVKAVFERDSDERQAIERCRTNAGHARGGIQADLHRNGVVLLHLLGGQSRCLCGDFQDHRRGIRIGFDIQLRECKDARTNEHEQPQQDDGTTGQAERKNSLQHNQSLSLFIGNSPVIAMRLTPAASRAALSRPPARSQAYC